VRREPPSLDPSPEYPLGPPLIGALLRMPMDAVVARILRDLHDAGCHWGGPELTYVN
jgi:hypothetical protein